MQNLEATSSEEVHLNVLQVVHIKLMQKVHLLRYNHFIALDKPNLRPLRPEAFEIRMRTVLKVQPNSYVYLGRDKAYYSVPYKLIGREVKVEYTPTLVAIYHDGVKVALHDRCYTIGKYNTIESHLPSYYNDYVNLSPEKYIDRALAISELLAEVMINIFTKKNGVPPEVHYKSCDGLFHLQKKAPCDIFEKACWIALEYNNCNYGFIKNLVESKCSGFQSMEDEPVLFPDDRHSNIRGKSYYESTH